MFILVRLLQPWKASTPREVIVEGSTTWVTSVQPQNATDPIPVTVYPLIAEGTVTMPVVFVGMAGASSTSSSPLGLPCKQHVLLVSTWNVKPDMLLVVGF